MNKLLHGLTLVAVAGVFTQLGACAAYPEQPGYYGSYDQSQSVYGGSYAPANQPPQEQVQYVSAPVLSATPVYQQVQVARPRQECRQVQVDNSGGHVAGTLVGGALGGLVGNQFGKGSGNAAMTALGAVAGAVAGNSVAGQNDGRVATQCRTVNDYVMQRQADGYDVSYRYNGQVYHTHSQSDPGSTIQIRVGVTPQ